jgi:DNA polymerase-3 subunit epsilon
MGIFCHVKLFARVLIINYNSGYSLTVPFKMLTNIKNNRLIFSDVETTGLNPLTGDRIVEIGMVEYIDRRPTGKTLQLYLNPQRSMPEAAFNVHGLSNEFLSDKPLFSDVATQVAEFIQGSELVFHNAPFDMGFLNMEFARIGFHSLNFPTLGIVDTLMMARQEDAGKRNSLDALCDRYGINNTSRTLHGALLDALLLGEVYVCMTRGQESLGMDFLLNSESVESRMYDDVVTSELFFSKASQMEAEAHSQYLSLMSKENGGKIIGWAQ